MSVQITHVASGEAFTAMLTLGYDARRDVGTIVHTVIGETAPEFTVQPGGPLTGTFDFLCANTDDGAKLRSLLGRPGMFSIADEANTIADSAIMVTGAIGLRLDEATQVRAIVTVDYTSVA